MSPSRYDVVEIFRWLPRQSIDCCRLVCRKWKRQLLKVPPDSLPLRHISKFVLNTDTSFRETYCTCDGNVITADYARPTGLITCAVGAFVDVAHLRLTFEELRLCLQQLHASDRLHINVLILAIYPPYSDLKSLKKLLLRHIKVDNFSLQLFDLLDARAAAHVVFECFPRSARMTSLEFVVRDEGQRDTKSSESFLGCFIKRFERLNDAKLLPNWMQCKVLRTQRQYLRHHSFWPTREERVRLPCGVCTATFDDEEEIVTDTVHAFNDKLNRRLTVRISYFADDYRGQATSMEFGVDSEQRCVSNYPVRRSNLVGDTFCEVFCFLDRCDIDGCQLVGRSWHRNVRRLNAILPHRTVIFCMNTDTSFRETYCTCDGNVITADYARPTGLITCAVGAFVDVAHLRLTFEELRLCLQQLHASDRLHINVLILAIYPPYSDLKSLKKLLLRHIKVDNFSLQLFDLLDARAAAHVVFECFPRSARRTSLEFVVRDEGQRDTKSSESFLGCFIKRFERLNDAKLLPNWMQCKVLRTQREYLRHHSFWPTREERVRLPCGVCTATFDDEEEIVTDTVHAFNDKLNRRLTVRISYFADDYRGQPTSMEFGVDSEQRCVSNYPVRRSNLVGDTFCEVFCFLDRCDIDGCQLVGRSWHRNVRRLNAILPLRTVIFCMKFDYSSRSIMITSGVSFKRSQRKFYSNLHKSIQVADSHDYVFLFVNAYVTELRIITLRFQPKQMARAWRRAIEGANGSCVIERLHVKMVSIAGWQDFLTTALEKATVRALELGDVHYHLGRVYYHYSSGIDYPTPWYRPWLPVSTQKALRRRCFRFKKNIFEPMLLQFMDLTIDPRHLSHWSQIPDCEVPTPSGLSAANLLRLIMDGIPGRRRLVIHAYNWDFAKLLSMIIQTFPKLRNRGTLPSRTELDAICWSKENLPSEWPTRDESEIFHVVNDFTRQRLTIAIPWRQHPHHPILERKTGLALILLDDGNYAE